MRSSYWGWIVAGVVCLIIITLAVTGIVNFNPSTAPTSSSSMARQVVESVETAKSSFVNAPLAMVA